MKYIVHIILLFLIVSCNTNDKVNNTTYFGGHIINPKSNFVHFMKDDIILDTLFLDNNNRFLGEYESLEEGLYSFYHGNEYQNIYLESTDSLLARLNTWDFDESLVFSGKGSRKNEFLIKLFLQNEEDEKQIHHYFKLAEKDFETKIDSIMQVNINKFKKFSHSESNLSNGYKKIATTAIYFPLYRMKEIYPLYHKKVNNHKEFTALSPEFYKHREHINLNDEDLIAYHPYQNYIINYMFNLGYTIKENDSLKKDITVNILNSIVDKIKSEKFKNTLLKTIIVSDFQNSESSCSINEAALNVFIANCTNQKAVKYVKNLVNDSQFVEINKPLKNFTIESFENTNLFINDVIKDKHSVIYFWSNKYFSPEYLVKRIGYLENKFPNVLFIGINIESNPIDVLSNPTLKPLNQEKQFILAKESTAKEFLTSHSPRSIVVNDGGFVINGFIPLNSKKLETELKKLHLN